MRQWIPYVHRIRRSNSNRQRSSNRVRKIYVITDLSGIQTFLDLVKSNSIYVNIHLISLEFEFRTVEFSKFVAFLRQAMDAIFNRLRNLDAYPKINEDFYRRTFSGGIITIASSFIMLFLFFSELRLYLHAKTETRLIVDTSRGGKLHINFDMSFPAIPCSILSIDAIDVSGEQHLDIRHNIIKKRTDYHGKIIEARPDNIGAPKIEKPLQRHGGRLEHNETYCGSCFGAESSDDECCNSCEEVREAYRKKGWAITNQELIDQCQREDFIQKVKDEEGEGCNIEGSLEVNKVAGSFNFVPGKSFHQSSFNFLGLFALQTSDYNVSHRINRLAFGDHYDGLVNPLDGVHWKYDKQNVMHQYFVKVVPTIYTDIGGRTVHSNQYSATEHFKSVEFGNSLSIPGVFFYYDLSPVKVTYSEEHVPFLHFMTHICAIVGGVFSVAGIVDAFIYHGQRKMKKVEIGKLG